MELFALCSFIFSAIVLLGIIAKAITDVFGDNATFGDWVEPRLREMIMKLK